MDTNGTVAVAWVAAVLVGLAVYSFRQPHRSASAPATLHFKDAEAAITYAAAYLEANVREGATLPCIVDHAQSHPSLGGVARIRVPHDGKTIQMLATLPAGEGDPTGLEGALCATLIGPKVPIGDAGHAAILVAVLEPTWTTAGWKIQRWMQPTEQDVRTHQPRETGVRQSDRDSGAVTGRWRSVLVWLIGGGAAGGVLAQGLYELGATEGIAVAWAMAAISLSAIAGYAADPALAQRAISFGHPIQRIAFLLVLASGAWLVGVSAWGSESVVQLFADGITFRRWSKKGASLAAYSFSIGLLFAYGYSFVIEPLAKWIRKG